MENWKLQSAVLSTASLVGGAIVVLSPEEWVSVLVITWFVVITVILAWPEYEEVEHIYNPDMEQPRRPATGKEAVKQFWAALSKGGWKTRKVKRRK